ncbi:uncharacterized protein [Temnothorax nylanderi]|uniref:uncharacterized protein n=1 Tax=Temnothorax nylanderi TaxID=102681 RepID=UPI003A86B230
MSLEVEGIVRSQNELHGRIARAYENFKKAGPSKITLGLTEARLQTLEANWAKFEAQHDQLLLQSQEDLDKLDYRKQNLPTVTEEAFIQQKGAFLDAIRIMKAKERSAAETAGAAGTPESTPRTTLPRIQLPHFSGKYEDWPSFRDLFQSILGKDSATTQVEKLHYLKSCLKGEAELLIRDVPTTGGNYERAWKTLSAYYENKRLLVRAYLANFIALPKMKSESAVELRKIFHGIKATVSSLDSIERAVGRNEDLFVHLAVELLDPQSRREWENSISAATEPPSYSVLEQFLDRRLHTLESMLPAKADGAANKASDGKRSTRSHLANKNEAKRGRCSLCQKEHILMFCDDYKKKTAGERKQYVEDNGLCLNCLGKHKVNDCAVKKNCYACGARHHSSLHDACRELVAARTSHVANESPVKPVAVLLATARVRVADRCGGWHTVRALIDQGSESSMISERLAQQLRLPRLPVAVSVFGVGGQKSGVARGRVSMTLSSRNDGHSFTISALVLPRLTVYTGGIETKTTSWPHLRGLELADPDYCSSDPIEVLLGADIYASILSEGLRKGGPREPVAQKTALGWILSGVIGDSISGHVAYTHQCRIEEDLVNVVRRFWEQEEAPSKTAALSKEEVECEKHFVLTHSRRSDGRYVVRLPLVSPLPDLSGTRRVAERVLRSMEGRFARDAALHAAYVEFMKQYAELGHMTPIHADDLNETRVCYLPHHGVMRATSSTTKLRVVFNGSATVPSGDSLNQHLMVGPNLLPALTDVLTRWRRHRFVFATDIEKMYRQIDVHRDDVDLLRILWRFDPREPMLEYWLTTVTYGLACSPHQAIRTMHQLAKDERHRFPEGASILEDDTYMDDVISGAKTLAAASEKRRQLEQICMAGGFPLKKWSANDEALLENVPVEDRLLKESRGWQPGESHLTLGLRWHPHEDQFSYTTQLIRTETFTKRTVLSLTARLFDPLGWLAPATVRAKILFQSTWLLGIDWDEPLPEEDARNWREFQSDLPSLEAIRVPRWLTSGDEDCRLELHGFADASERAYAAVVYLRIESGDGKVEVRLLEAKTKVAPLKQVTLPRMELSAAALLVRIAEHAQRTLEAKDVPTHLWSDAKVVLGWIRGHPSSWKTYVANRVSEIQTTLPEAIWHHVPGRENPADCASRGISPEELVNHPLWWQGPPWLKTESSPWTAIQATELPVDLPDRRTNVHAAATSAKVDEPPELTECSSLQRLLRRTAWCRRWLRRLPRRRTVADSQADLEVPFVLQSSELDEARRCWIRVVQEAAFNEELRAISKGEQLPARSGIAKLNPLRDERGILRVGGRLRHARLNPDAKHPVILPSESHFTRLVIEAHHRRTLHGGVQMTLGSIRQECWIPRGRSLVKRCIHRCITCLRWRAASPQPLMGDLPPPRVTPARPFLNTGIDYAGPVWLRTSKGRGQHAAKAFITVFICLSSRAVHLDVASDYSADAFLAALRRFVARRGLCRTLYSDCGTNFVGADAQLRALFSASDPEGRRIAARLAEERIQWHFNPPAAPNFGGIWEAAVKSMKFHLRRVIGDAKLTYEEMATVLAQIEACLNSRPLQAISDDPEDFTALTPGHFLIGSALNAVPEPSLAEESTSRLSRWQLLQSIRDRFWDR